MNLEQEIARLERAVKFENDAFKDAIKLVDEKDAELSRLQETVEAQDNQLYERGRKLEDAQHEIIALREEVERLKGEEQDMIDMWAKIDNYKARIKELEQGLREMIDVTATALIALDGDDTEAMKSSAQRFAKRMPAIAALLNKEQEVAKRERSDANTLNSSTDPDNQISSKE